MSSLAALHNAPSVQQRVSREEWEVRVTLVAACQLTVLSDRNVDQLHAPQAAIENVHEQSAHFADGQGPGVKLHRDALTCQVERAYGQSDKD